MSSPPVAVPAAFASSSPLVASREQYDALYARSLGDPAAFWGEIAEGFHWDRCGGREGGRWEGVAGGKP